ncbi:hypothetical protein M513_06944 [Trichuris suis]|uniref:Transcription factor IIIC subunit 5 HTH domain-containing protein n=1 Tax=Trichuris suis TaxID=68888 RepID=A0A085M4T5_9BILA|nr:hypothetical protein M513_06944 [Trichuris suis]
MSIGRYIAIQYPGIVKNVDKAVQNLGGYEKIVTDHQVLQSLELNPTGGSNVFARPTTSNFTIGVYLVVRARRVRRNNPTDGTGDYDTTFEILAKLPGIHQFFNLYDFQFHPMVRVDNGQSSENPSYESIYDKLVPSNRESALSMFREPYPSVEPFCLPMRFSQYPQANRNILQVDAVSKHTKETTPIAGLENRNQNGIFRFLGTGGDRRQYSCLVNATDPFPENPPTDAVTFADEKCPDMSVHEMFEKVLQERPVWNKTDLRKKLSLDRSMFQALLPKFAFYIQTGPWARLWCRYGYDPRKNPEACLYQSITVSFERFGFTVLDIPDNSAQNEVNWMMPSNLRAGRPTVKNRKTDCGNEYNPGVIPSKRLAAYQLCDVHLPEVQQLVKMRCVAN